MAGDYDRRKLVETIHRATLTAIADVRELVEHSREAIASSRAMLARTQRRSHDVSDDAKLGPGERKGITPKPRGDE